MFANGSNGNCRLIPRPIKTGARSGAPCHNPDCVLAIRPHHHGDIATGSHVSGRAGALGLSPMTCCLCPISSAVTPSSFRSVRPMTRAAAECLIRPSGFQRALLVPSLVDPVEGRLYTSRQEPSRYLRGSGRTFCKGDEDERLHHLLQRGLGANQQGQD